MGAGTGRWCSRVPHRLTVDPESAMLTRCPSGRHHPSEALAYLNDKSSTAHDQATGGVPR